jgi:hypothetical protein
MSLWNMKEEFEHYDDLDVQRPTDRCFLCGEILGGDLVVEQWGCNDSPDEDTRYCEQIWLHPECARELALRLLEDYKESKWTEAQRKAHRRRTLRELGIPDHGD